MIRFETKGVVIMTEMTKDTIDKSDACKDYLYELMLEAEIALNCMLPMKLSSGKQVAFRFHLNLVEENGR
jgi:hypothetical protein